MLASELRKKINDKIKLWAKSDTPTELQSKIVSSTLYFDFLWNKFNKLPIWDCK